MKLKRRVIWYVLLAVGFAVFWFTFGRGGRVTIKQLEWHLSGEKVSYSFYVDNGTFEAVRPHVILVAETQSATADGVITRPLGRAEVDLELEALTKRQVHGSFQLEHPGDTHLIIRPQVVLPAKDRP